MTDEVELRHATRGFRPSKDAFRAILQHFSFIDDIEIHRSEGSLWSSKYSIVCTVSPGENFEECREIIHTAISMAVQPWRVVTNLLVRASGDDGDVIEAQWRLGGLP